MNVAHELIEAALSAVEPRRITAEAIEPATHVLAVGKAAAAMYLGAADALGSRIEDALVVAKHAADLDVAFMRGDHPIPGPNSLRAATEVIAFVDRLTARDRLAVLLSGGASALLAAPVEGLSLADLGQLTARLMNAGASIDELNTVRRQVDVIKGGGLAARCAAPITTYLLSDVLGDAIETIGSGLTAPNPTSHADAEAVLRRHLIDFELMPKPRATPPAVTHRVIANFRKAIEAARHRAEELGLHATVWSAEVRGEARDAGRSFARELLAYEGPRPACLIGGGETTVTVRGRGRGGPSLEFALAVAERIAGVEGVSAVTFATDGEDGPTDAAGAFVGGGTVRRGAELGLDAAASLADNDAYSYFEGLGDLLMTGPTGTNVNDLVFGFVGFR